MSKGVERCAWALRSELELTYHDTEWGRPEFDDEVLFELLVLEMMQSGLSWSIILKKREAMRLAFDGFDMRKIAEYGEEKLEELLANETIIRNRMKLTAMINNATCFMAIQQELGSFSEYLWGFVNHEPVHNTWEYEHEIPASSSLSYELTKDLKKRGFRFVGPTIVYSFLQAAGVVNDHITSCFCYDEIVNLRS